MLNKMTDKNLYKYNVVIIKKIRIGNFYKSLKTKLYSLSVAKYNRTNQKINLHKFHHFL